MDAVLDALAAQQAELSTLLSPLDDRQWHTATRCPGWDVADVVLHLVQTNQMAIGSATGRLGEVAAELVGERAPAGSVDDGAAWLVERQRGLAPDVLLDRWSSGAAHLLAALEGLDLSTRVDWVAGQLSARSLATTRIAETWIHTGDVAAAVGVTLVPTDRLRLVARLAWRTLPYAFDTAGRSMTGPVAFRLVGPGGDAWDFEPDQPALTTISGSALELCEVAARRRLAADTVLAGEGPDAEAVLALVRTYA